MFSMIGSPLALKPMITGKSMNKTGAIHTAKLLKGMQRVMYLSLIRPILSAATLLFWSFLLVGLGILNSVGFLARVSQDISSWRGNQTAST